MFKRTWILPLLLLSAIYFISGTASSNPVAYNPAETCLVAFIAIFVLNLPINLVLYVGLVFFIVLRKNRERLEEKPGTFLERVLIVTFLATFFGVISDLILMIDTYNFFLIGLFLIFISYFFLIIFVHKLTKVEALKICVGIVIANSIVWPIIIFSKIVIYHVAFIGIVGFIGSIFVLFLLWQWYNTHYVFSKKVQRKTILNKSFRCKERIIASILDAHTSLKNISIFFTDRQIIITRKGLRENIEEILHRDKVIVRIPYDQIIYIHFNVEFLNNDLVIKSETRTIKYYCDREEMIIAKYKLKKAFAGLLLIN